VYTTHNFFAVLDDISAYEAGGGVLQPLDSGKTIIFWAKANFFRQQPAARNEKGILFVFIKRKNGIHSI